MKEKFTPLGNEESKKEEDPKGHPSLIYKDGHFWFPEFDRVHGTRIHATPNMKIGPEEYHRDLFIEYERTFGRGRAYNFTHEFIPSIHEIRKEYGEEAEQFLDDYHNLANEYSRVVGKKGSRKKTEELIKKIKDYRKKYPWLYGDVEDSDDSIHVNLLEEK